MEKRYFYKHAHLANTEIFMYVDGKLTGTDIINDYDLDGYTRRLLDEGYIDEGYIYGYSSEEVEHLRECYENAKEAHEIARRNMINIEEV